MPNLLHITENNILLINQPKEITHKYGINNSCVDCCDIVHIDVDAKGIAANDAWLDRSWSLWDGGGEKVAC